MPYVENEVFKKNPFATLDASGVGQLVEIAVKKGRATRLGICGEHGGDPDSVKFFHKAGLAYVSCSPYRVPVGRLAAAQAAIEEKTQRPRREGPRQKGRQEEVIRFSDQPKSQSRPGAIRDGFLL